MTRTLHATAYQLACWDAAKQARRENGRLDDEFEIELAASDLLDAQYGWYLERAARLRRVQQ